MTNQTPHSQSIKLLSNWEGQMKPDSDIFVVDLNTWATMTENEQEKYLDELLGTKKTFILNGMKYVEVSNQGPIA